MGCHRLTTATLRHFLSCTGGKLSNFIPFPCRQQETSSVRKPRARLQVRGPAAGDVRVGCPSAVLQGSTLCVNVNNNKALRWSIKREPTGSTQQRHMLSQKRDPRMFF